LFLNGLKTTEEINKYFHCYTFKTYKSCEVIFIYQHVQGRCVCYEFRNILKASNHMRQCCVCPANQSITTKHDLHNFPFWLRSKCQNPTAQVVPSLQNGATVMLVAPLSCGIALQQSYSRFIMHLSHWSFLDTSN